MTGSTQTAASSEGVSLFLTAYDPSDLPGGSIDPLGFERGYLFLADKILPGLTNVASLPRYFSVLCAGASLALTDVSDTPRRQYQSRLDCILRFERFWALANVLASAQAPEGKLPLGGIRGVTYAEAKAKSTLGARVRRVSSDFKLLSRQVPYGVVGIYGAVADGMRLLDRKTFTLTPDLGGRLADGFLDETSAPAVLLKAVREDGDVSLDGLAEWGQRAHIARGPLQAERGPMAEALRRDPVRARMAAVLAGHPFQSDRETELQRLKRLLPALSRDSVSADLEEAVSIILAYEACYQLVMLAFERLLWACRSMPAAAVRAAELASDPVLQLVRARTPAAVRHFGKLLDEARTEQFLAGLDRLGDVRRFLEVAAAASGSVESLARELLTRHADVQRGKFDRGRRKMPWLEETAGRISLTMTRVGGLDREAKLPGDIGPHPYRLSSADALVAAAGGA